MKTFADAAAARDKKKKMVEEKVQARFIMAAAAGSESSAIEVEAVAIKDKEEKKRPEVVVEEVPTDPVQKLLWQLVQFNVKAEAAQKKSDEKAAAVSAVEKLMTEGHYFFDVAATLGFIGLYVILVCCLFLAPVPQV